MSDSNDPRDIAEALLSLAHTLPLEPGPSDGVLPLEAVEHESVVAEALSALEIPIQSPIAHNAARAVTRRPARGWPVLHVDTTLAPAGHIPDVPAAPRPTQQAVSDMSSRANQMHVDEDLLVPMREPAGRGRPRGAGSRPGFFARAAEAALAPRLAPRRRRKRSSLLLLR